MTQYDVAVTSQLAYWSDRCV